MRGGTALRGAVHAKSGARPNLLPAKTPLEAGRKTLPIGSGIAAENCETRIKSSSPEPKSVLRHPCLDNHRYAVAGPLDRHIIRRNPVTRSTLHHYQCHRLK